MPLVRCPTHGRIYDSDQAQGCPLCLSGAPAAAATPPPEKKGSPTRLLILLAALVVAGGGYLGWRFHQKQQAEAAAAAALERQRMIAPPAPDTTKFARADDLTPIRRARALRSALESLSRGSRSTLLAFAEGPVDTSVADRAAKRRAQQYLRFAERWHQRLDDAARGVADIRYAPGVQYSLQMDQVSNYLGAALTVLRDLVPRDRVKSRSERGSDLTSVAGYLRGAGTILTNLPR